MTETAASVGLFIGSYLVGNAGMPGAPLLTLNLAFNAPHHTVSGVAQVTQAVNPPLVLNSHVSGTYTEMTVMGPVTYIQIRLTGYGINPGIPALANLEVVLVLDDGWQTGTGQFKYLNNNNEWVVVEGAPVKAVPPTVK